MVRDGQVGNQPFYAAIGVDLNGRRDVLGLWAGQGGGESAKFWMNVLADLKNRGVRDVFFIVCDGLKGLPDSVNAVFPQAIVQACVIHLIRATLRYASRKYWDHLAKDLRRVEIRRVLHARYRRAVTVRGHFPTEQAALKCLYLVTRGLDPKGTGQARWTMRWKPALNAFAVTFADRMPAAENL